MWFARIIEKTQTRYGDIILSTILNIETIAIIMPDIRNYRHIYCIKRTFDRYNVEHTSYNKCLFITKICYRKAFGQSDRTYLLAW